MKNKKMEEGPKREKIKIGPIFKQKLELVRLRQEELLNEARSLQKKADGFNIAVDFERVQTAETTTLWKMEKYVLSEGTKKKKEKLKEWNSEMATQKEIANDTELGETGKFNKAIKKLNDLDKEKSSFLMSF